MMGKVVERLIKMRAMDFLEEITFLREMQFGFRESRSAIDALNELKSYTTNTLDNKKYCDIFSFDIEGAFDTVDCKNNLPKNR